MWRKHGDDVSAVVVLLVFSVQAVALAALTWALVLRPADRLPTGPLPTLVVGTLTIAALALLMIGAPFLGFHALSSRRARGRRQRLEAWTERWVGVLFEGHAPPPQPLPPEAIESLLDLREALDGTEGERVEWLVRRSGLARELLHRSEAVGRSGAPRPVSPFRRRRLSSRVEALEALAKARIGQTIDPLLGLLQDREPAIRIMALRSVARTLARLPEGPGRDGAAERFVEAIATADVPPGAIEESLLLLEGAGPPVLSRLVAAASTEAGIDDARLVSAIGAIARLRLVTLADLVAPFCAHSDPEVRAAAVRALGLIGVLPSSAGKSIDAALRDPVEYVRVQASRTASLLPRTEARQALWDLLGDLSWWVRRGAAHGLLGLGAEGAGDLERATRTHSDPFARQMAVQVLLETGRLEAARARRLGGR